MNNFTIYKSITRRLSLLKIENDEEFVFTKKLFKKDLSPITLDNLIVRKLTRSFQDAIEEKMPFEIIQFHSFIDWYTYKSEYLNFGVLLFHLLLSTKSYIEIQLAHSNTEIKTIYIYLNRRIINNSSLEVNTTETYKSYHYYPWSVDKFALSPAHRDIHVKDSPSFYYGWSNSTDSQGENRDQKADQLIIWLEIEGLCALAELFIDIGRDENDQDEICLENPTNGFGGVGKDSLDVRFWLPNSFGFYGNHLDELHFT